MSNPRLELARELVRATDRSVFLTGKAGTGKTTFLHAVERDMPKRMIVTAPTGVAAINARGVTLHSFFQLPFGPFVPGGEVERQAAERRFSRRKRDIIESLDLLVIDEISMVRCDLLDAVDFVLRRQRHRDRPFGGVKLLLIGDLHQLAPVVREQDWAILKKGAQVMFVRNDSASERRYFNGKIGTITHIERDRILVRCAGDEGDIEVEPVA